MPRVRTKLFEIPASRTGARLLPDLKQGKPKEKKIPTRPIHELYCLTTIEEMIDLLEKGYSLVAYNIFIKKQLWVMLLSRKYDEKPFTLKIALPFFFGAREEESPECALLRNLLKLREEINISQEKTQK